MLTDPVAVTRRPEDLRAGIWAVVLTFEGHLTAVRFATRSRDAGTVPGEGGEWIGPTGPWRTSLARPGYLAAVAEIRQRIADGTVYQVNLCRIDEAPLSDQSLLPSLGIRLREAHPAPHAATIHIPGAGLDIVSASPESFLMRSGGRIVSRPIKGTARRLPEMLAKDYAENVMIADLVRNDLQRVCAPGSVVVDRLCGPEEHPGLVHLVTDVAGTLRPDASWAGILAATAPAGSVSGAPKSTALQAISDLEPAPRGPYCGALGWIDVDRDEAVLAVGIRTFWSESREDGRWLRFGTGAGITWGSDAAAEWQECDLKAERLQALASARPDGADPVTTGGG